MVRRLTRDEFIEKAIAKHGEGEFLYDKVEYDMSKKPVMITCSVCSRDFPQTPSMHLQGHGCPDCALEKKKEVASRKRKKAADEFEEKANAKHGKGTFLYDKVKYGTVKIPVLIGCRKCENYFPQTPNNHLRGQGCPDCGLEKLREASRRKKNKDKHTAKSKQSRRPDQIRKHTSDLNPVFNVFAHNFICNVYFVLK